ncbi:hypothetical protein AB0E88_08775 [Streptomyces sp. NPDC028635]|uniref:hypothetical protein n=1 Tax=Streptomyces sp. NPDC028635 TaxID=3154800 RepID=UPI0033C24CDC
MTVVHEINTLVRLGELTERYGRPVTPGDVPGEAWDTVARPAEPPDEDPRGTRRRRTDLLTR